MLSFILFCFGGWYYASKETKITKSVDGAIPLSRFVFVINFLFWWLFLIFTWSGINKNNKNRIIL